MNRMEYAGKIGGLVGGFKRRERQKFLIMFVKLIEMDELHDIRMTSNLAKKLIAAFSGCKSISNDVLIKEFARSGNSVKQQNLDMIVHSLVARWQDLYEEQWKEAKIKIDIEADEYKQSIIEKLDIKLYIHVKPHFTYLYP